MKVTIRERSKEFVEREEEIEFPLYRVREEGENYTTTYLTKVISPTEEVTLTIEDEGDLSSVHFSDPGLNRAIEDVGFGHVLGRDQRPCDPERFERRLSEALTRLEKFRGAARSER